MGAAVVTRWGGYGGGSSFNRASNSATSRSGSVGAQHIPALAPACRTLFVPVGIKSKMAFALNLGFDLCNHDPPGAVARAAQLLYPLVAAQRLPLNFVKSLPEGLEFAPAVPSIIIRFLQLLPTRIFCSSQR